MSENPKPIHEYCPICGVAFKVHHVDELDICIKVGTIRNQELDRKMKLQKLMN